MATSCGLGFGKVRGGDWRQPGQLAEMTRIYQHSATPKVIQAMHIVVPLTRSLPADIVKMVESEPELAARIRRVRGGYLKIQGTWMPYEVRSVVILG